MKYGYLIAGSGLFGSVFAKQWEKGQEAYYPINDEKKF